MVRHDRHLRFVPVALDRETLGAARLRLTHSGNPWGMPYLSSILFALIPVESHAVSTLAVDANFRLYINPEFMATLTVDELAGVLAHEAGHLMRGHSIRFEEQGHPAGDHSLYNIAGDMCINQDLEDAGVPMPSDVMLPEVFGLPRGLYTEEYFDLLKQKQDELSGQHSDGGQGDGSDETGEGSGDGPLSPHGDCGSCAGGNPREWENGPETADAGAISEANGDLIRRETARAIRETSRGRGNVPAGMDRWAEELLTPKVDWRRWFAGQISAATQYVAGKVDYTYRRPNRRGLINGVVFPSMHKPVPRVAAVVDTSGSMSDDDLAEALSEIAGMLKAAGTPGQRITVLSCDADAGVAQQVASAQRINLSGGGGTDMRVGVDAALKLHPKPDVIVVLTDGYTPWPDEPVAAKVIAAITSGGTTQGIPEWIPAIQIPED